MEGEDISISVDACEPWLHGHVEKAECPPTAQPVVFEDTLPPTNIEVCTKPLSKRKVDTFYRNLCTSMFGGRVPCLGGFEGTPNAKPPFSAGFDAPHVTKLRFLQLLP